ncbi:hypothetical protein D3C81_687960 [compost metagenome]
MKYYIYNSRTNSMITCNSLEDLIRYFSRGNYNCWGKKDKRNSYFQDIAMNWNDVKTEVDKSYYNERLYTTTHQIPRNIMVFDEYDRTIDPRDFKYQILNYVYKYSYQKKTHKYEFRKDPVPRVRKYRQHRGSFYRHPRTTQEIRFSCDDEVKLFINPSRNIKNLPNAWDEIPRNRDHCWKEKRIKKQWMKHKK